MTTSVIDIIINNKFRIGLSTTICFSNIFMNSTFGKKVDRPKYEILFGVYLAVFLRNNNLVCKFDCGIHEYLTFYGTIDK